MNLGIFLGVGESLKQMEKSGQKERFIKLYLKTYSKQFKKIYLFSYENESYHLPENVILVPKTVNIHRYIYAIFLPFIHRNKINNCDMIRGFGLTSSISSFLSNKSFVFNWAYDYQEFAKIEKKYIFIPIYLILEKLAFIKAKKVLIATKDKFNSLTGNKFIYLPNGVNLRQFNGKIMNKGIIFVGRIEKQKNLKFLIDSVARLPKHLRTLTILGDGSEKLKVKKYAQKKNVKLTILKPVENDKLPKVLRNFSIFALASHAEGSPKALLESMAIGLVPVINNFKGADGIIKNGKDGYIVDYSKKEFANRLEALLKDDELTLKFSKNAIDKIKKEFNFESLMNLELNVLKNAG